jgi:uncharacterized membrane protein
MAFVVLKEVVNRSEVSTACANLTTKLNTMYTGLLHTHSYLRYFILILLIIVIIISLIGLINKKPYTRTDNKIGLFLFICTHIQLLVGIILFFVSPFVQFSGSAMKDPTTRYWLVEHNTAMLIAVVFITLARTTSKKMTVDQQKHKRMFLFNLIALVIIIATIALSGRNLF